MRISSILVVCLYILASTAAKTSRTDGLLYVVGKTEEKHTLKFYGFSTPDGRVVHDHRWVYDTKHQGQAVVHHEDLGVAFNQKRHLFLITDNVSMMEIRANKPQLVTREPVSQLHNPAKNDLQDNSCIVAIEYDRVHDYAIVVSDQHQEPDTLEFNLLKPSNGVTKFMCRSKFGDVDAAKHGIHTWDPVGDKLYYVIGKNDEANDYITREQKLITYVLKTCSVEYDPPLQEEAIIDSAPIDGKPQHMHMLLSFDYSELTNSLIAMMTTHDESVVLTKVYPTSGRIVQIANYSVFTEGYHYVQGVTYLDFEHPVHFSIWLEMAQVVVEPVLLAGKHKEYNIKARVIGVDIQSGEVVVNFDTDVNHSFIPRGLGFVPAPRNDRDEL